MRLLAALQVFVDENKHEAETQLLGKSQEHRIEDETLSRIRKNS